MTDKICYWDELEGVQKERDATPEEQADIDERRANAGKLTEADAVVAVQQRLDDFARTRGYDGILSACTYANSTLPRFAIEGARCVSLRDETWAACYDVLAQVQAGTRPVPTWAELEAELPALTWPA